MGAAGEQHEGGMLAVAVGQGVEAGAAVGQAVQGLEAGTAVVWKNSEHKGGCSELAVG